MVKPREGFLGAITILDEDGYGTVTATNARIINVTNPIDAQDVATKNYVDGYISANNEWSEILANGNISGGTNPEISCGDQIQAENGCDLVLATTSDGYIILKRNGGEVARFNQGELSPWGTVEQLLLQTEILEFDSTLPTPTIRQGNVNKPTGGPSFMIRAADNLGSGSCGDVSILSGAAPNGAGCNVSLGGLGSKTGTGTSVDIYSGESTEGAGGNVNITAKDGYTDGGWIGITTGTATTGQGGTLNLTTGDGVTSGGWVNIIAGDISGDGVVANGPDVTINAGDATGVGSQAGHINIQTGRGIGSGSTGGNLSLTANSGTLDGGGVNFSAGPGSTGDGGWISINGGSGGTDGGYVNISAGSSTFFTGEQGGYLNLSAGSSNSGYDGAYASLSAGSAVSGSGKGGELRLIAGNAYNSGNSDGGDVSINSGRGYGTGVDGYIILESGITEVVRFGTGSLLMQFGDSDDVSIGFPVPDPDANGVLLSILGQDGADAVDLDSVAGTGGDVYISSGSGGDGYTTDGYVVFGAGAGDIILNAGAGGLYDGYVIIQRGGNEVARFDDESGSERLLLKTVLEIGTDAATSGTIRLPSAESINWLNDVGDGDISGITTDASDNLIVGGTNAAQVRLNVGSSNILRVLDGVVQFQANVARFAASLLNPTLFQADDPANGAAGDLLTIHAQDVTGDGYTYGGHMLIRAGYGTGGGTPIDGNVGLHASPAAWQDLERGIFIGDAVTVPTGDPTSGIFEYVESGTKKVRSPNSVITTVAPNGTSDGYTQVLLSEIGTETTYNGAITTVVVATIPTDYYGMVTVDVTAEDQADPANAYGFQNVYLVSNDSGAVTLRDSSNVPIEMDPGATGVAASVDANGATVRARATGNVGENWTWTAHINGLLCERSV
jgi:hypothetical protein